MILAGINFVRDTHRNYRVGRQRDAFALCRNVGSALIPPRSIVIWSSGVVAPSIIWILRLTSLLPIVLRICRVPFTLPRSLRISTISCPPCKQNHCAHHHQCRRNLSVHHYPLVENLKYFPRGWTLRYLLSVGCLYAPNCVQ